MANARQRDLIRTLQRRRDFLSDRIAQMDERGAPPEQGHHDRAERKALRWALRVVLAADHEGILHDLEAVAVEGARS